MSAGRRSQLAALVALMSFGALHATTAHAAEPPPTAPLARPLRPRDPSAAEVLAPVGGYARGSGGRLDARGGAAATVVATGFATLLATADDSTIGDVGDTLQFALPVGAYGLTALHGDARGAWQLSQVTLAQLGVTQGLKALISKGRPGGFDDRSFPSGHTAAAFSAAGFVAERYGWNLGLPAYLLAALTGASRVRTDNHFLDDVVGGASIGILVSHLFSTPWNPGDAQACAAPRRWRFDLEVGSFESAENDLRPDEGAGGTLELGDLDALEAQDVFARAQLTYRLGRRSEVFAGIAPLEQKGIVDLAQPLAFGHVVFPAGQTVTIHWLVHDEYVGWRATLARRRAIELKAGLVLSRRVRMAEVTSADGSLSEGVSDVDVLVEPHLHAQWKLSPRWSALLEGQGIVLPDNHDLGVHAALRYQLPDGWDLSLGYRFTLGASHGDTSDVNGRWRYHSLLLGVGIDF